MHKDVLYCTYLDECVFPTPRKEVGMAATSSTGVKTTEGQVAGGLKPAEFSLIETVCDTFFPSLEPPAGSSEAVAAYFRRKASDLSVPMLESESLSYERAVALANFRHL